MMAKVDTGLLGRIVPILKSHTSIRFRFQMVGNVCLKRINSSADNTSQTVSSTYLLLLLPNVYFLMSNLHLFLNMVIVYTAAVCIRIDDRGTARGYNITFLKSCSNIRVRLGFKDSVRVKVRVRVRLRVSCLNMTPAKLR